MSSYGKSSYSGKTQSAGVSWYNHVSRKFMIPYGIKKKDDYFEDKELLGVMKPTTCEMLCRPSIGMSEFGESVEHSPPIIRSLHRQNRSRQSYRSSGRSQAAFRNVQHSWKLSSGPKPVRSETSYKIYDPAE